MGYNISARARSAKLQAKMVAFMREHYRTWNAVSESKGREVEQPPSDDVSGSNGVGFHYSAVSGLAREWIYAVVRWMALKVGTRRSRFAKDIVEPAVGGPIPYLLYDGYQAWPIIVVSSAEEALQLPGNQRYHAQDRYGAHILLKNYIESSMVFMDQGVGKELVEAVMAQWAEMEPAPEYLSESYTEWLVKRDDIMFEALKPFLTEKHELLRGELERLDALWEAQS